MEDWQLLEAYGVRGDHAAFATLVARHRDWVYWACVRRLGDSGLAEDAAQAVFIALARQAGTLARREGGLKLERWLHEATRMAAANLRRGEIRRKGHEMEAAAMKTEAQGETWHAMESQMEPALDRLSAGDREVIVRRFYRHMTHAEIATSLAISEKAASKRVDRALERLRLALKKRGIQTGAEALGIALLAHAVRPVPEVVAAKLALAASAAAGAGNVSGQALAMSRGVLHMMRWAKLKMAAWVAVPTAVVVAAVAAATPLVLAQQEPGVTQVRAAEFVGAAQTAPATPAPATLPPISIDLHDANIADTAAALSKAMGITIGTSDTSDAKFTLTAKDKPFWEVYLELNRQHSLYYGVRAVPPTGVGLSISFPPAWDRGPMQTAGPLLIVPLASVPGGAVRGRARGTAVATAPADPLHRSLRLTVVGDPRMLMQMPNLQLSELRDGNGNPIKVNSIQAERLSTVPSGAGGQPMVADHQRANYWSWDIDLSVGDAGVKKMAIVRGSVSLSMAVKTQTITVDETDKRLAGGIAVGRCTFTYSGVTPVSGPPGSNAAPVRSVVHMGLQPNDPMIAITVANAHDVPLGTFHGQRELPSGPAGNEVVANDNLVKPLKFTITYPVEIGGVTIPFELKDVPSAN